MITFYTLTEEAYRYYCAHTKSKMTIEKDLLALRLSALIHHATDSLPTDQATLYTTYFFVNFAMVVDGKTKEIVSVNWSTTQDARRLTKKEYLALQKTYFKIGLDKTGFCKQNMLA